MKKMNYLGKMDHVGTAAHGRAKLGRQITFEDAVLFGGKKQKTKIHSRDRLQTGKQYRGPAILTEYSATTVIPPGATFRVDKAANLVIAL